MKQRKLSEIHSAFSYPNIIFDSLILSDSFTIKYRINEYAIANRKVKTKLYTNILFTKIFSMFSVDKAFENATDKLVDKNVVKNTYICIYFEPSFDKPFEIIGLSIFPTIYSYISFNIVITNIEYNDPIALKNRNVLNNINKDIAF